MLQESVGRMLQRLSFVSSPSEFSQGQRGLLRHVCQKYLKMYTSYSYKGKRQLLEQTEERPKSFKKRLRKEIHEYKSLEMFPHILIY
jgi:hypothetical protein